ncbi:hypothetical protein OAQ99_03780 [Candidatus Kapabacteria bacterium]|nr:hypothetical protein [Candidatus Kapabacteria bacterium]
MDVKNIANAGSTSYDPFLVDALNIGKKDAKKTDGLSNKESLNDAPPSKWQQDILLGAIDSLEDNIKVDNNNPLFAENAAPIETYQEALSELKMLVTNDFDKYASDAQANLTPGDILYLFEDQMDIVA